ncbi:MAG: TIGR03663 family protein [Chloroflexaceae bacterium]|nr:TIGR03663 family protein [Chloroflexaceae bacterium]
MTTTETTPKLLPAIEQPGLIAVPVAEPAVRGAFPTFEQVVYLALAVLAAIAHFWMLDVRALHHDETLHATYSWYIYIGNGYMHDPLLHGPFLYYLGSFLYFLFGDTDFSARLGAALFGTILTVLPFFIRREIGRTAALAASVYLLLSPTFLYVGRFFRHDIYSIVFELLVVIAIVRYASTRRALWLYVGIAAFALMYVNQETSYLFLLMMATPLVLLLLWRVFKPGILLVGALGVALALLVFVLPGEAVVDGSHTAERDPQTDEMVILAPGPIFGWGPIETEDNNYALRIRNRADNTAGNLFASMAGYIGDLWLFFRHPAILTGIGLLLGTIALLVWLIWLRRDSEGRSVWARATATGDPILSTYGSLLADRRWISALALGFSIYAIFFTAFFTNIIGLISGTTGSLLYWLAQHNVERGGQPSHYYLFLLGVYEPIVLLGASPVRA